MILKYVYSGRSYFYLFEILIGKCINIHVVLSVLTINIRRSMNFRLKDERERKVTIIPAGNKMFCYQTNNMAVFLKMPFLMTSDYMLHLIK